MKPISIEALRGMAETPPGAAIDIPDAEAPGLVWRMAQALVAAHEFANIVLDADGSRATITFRDPEAMQSWTTLCAHLGKEG
jgi:hypothetical protein